ncbi:hypothetical protein RND71_018455 [Anisodus tanguticus]|uniref:Uncharacterized protein n=1 Tax=Anisodus tanguticus TaxID=243964 RepID=A0AAE1S5F0_9SOLA|nr:hypothetical protein RND71_018455 [Anisodus tanguticus]
MIDLSSSSKHQFSDNHYEPNKVRTAVIWKQDYCEKCLKVGHKCGNVPRGNQQSQANRTRSQHPQTETQARPTDRRQGAKKITQTWQTIHRPIGGQTAQATTQPLPPRTDNDLLQP